LDAITGGVHFKSIPIEDSPVTLRGSCTELTLVPAAGFTKYRFENQTMVCLTTVYGMGI
jgi:hypothetical protein